MPIRRAPVVWAGLVLLAIVGLPGPVAAQGNIELGPFRILPSLELAVEYDDNILLTADNEIEDFIWIISPGIVIELPSRRYAVRLGYRADILRYMENDQFDTVHHNLLADARVNFAGGLGLRLSDRFVITDEFAGFPVPELTQLVERTENTLDVGADYTLRERYSFDVNYRWFLVDYEDDFDDLNRQDHTVAGTFFYRFLPKTSVLGEIDYVVVRYEDPSAAEIRDSDGWRFWVGLKGDLTAKTTALIKAGWEWKNYENPTQEDWDGLIAEASVIWKYRDPSDVRLFAGRANVESTFEGQNYYVTTFGGLEVRHFLSERLILRVAGLGGVNDYPEDTTIGTETARRSDVFVQAGVTLKYQMRRWLAFELGYNYLNLNSNFNEFDYQDNRVKASVLLSY